MFKYLYTAGYILLNGLSVLLINQIGRHIPTDIMIMLSSLYALIFFHILNIGGLGKLYKKLYEQKKLYLTTTFIFLVMWLVSFIMPVSYTPAILMFYATAWPALFGSYEKYKKHQHSISKYTTLCIAITILAFYVSLNHVYQGDRYIMLISGTLLAGISMFLYSKYSFKMNEAGFSPSQILASRIILLVLFSFAWSCYHGDIARINMEMAVQASILSIACLILPIFCSQISIKRVGPVNHSIAMGITPFVAFVFEYIYLGKNDAVSFDGTFSFLLMAIIVIPPLISLYLLKTKPAA